MGGGRGPARPVALLFALPLALAAAAAPAAAQQDTALTELAVEVRIPHGPDSLFIALARSDSAVLLPVRPLLDLVEIRITELVPGRRLAARLGDPPVPFGFDTEPPRAWRGDSALALGPRDAVWRDGELYVTTGALGAALGVEMLMDWSELLVQIANADSLPVMQRLERDRRRALLLRSRESTPLDSLPLAGAHTAFADGLAVDWAVTTASRAPLDNSGLQLGIGASILGGGLDVLSTTTRSPAGTSTQTYASWGIAWEDRPWLRQIRLGDITSGGPRGTPVRGAVVTNVPYLRSSDFASQQLFGALPPGWEVEVFRGDQLLGFTPVDSTGRYGVAVPLVYGPNPVQTVAYGPHGEVRRFDRTFVVPFERVPASRFEYNLGGGQCRGQPCAAAANADLRYGISNRVTAEAGLDAYWRDSLPDLTHPYGLVNVAITRPLAVTGELVARGYARGRLDVDPTPDFHFDAALTRFDTSVVQPLLGSALVAHQGDWSLFWRPGVVTSELFVQAGGRYQRGASRTHTGTRVSLTTRLLGARTAVQVRYDTDRPAGGLTAVLGALDVGSNGVVSRGRFQGTFLRGSASLECRGAALGSCAARLARWSAGIGRQVARVLRLDAGLRHEAGAGLALEVTLTAAFPWMRATSRNSYSDASVSGTQLFEGTVLWNTRLHQLELSNGRNLGHAGVAGMVYFDANANGMYDEGEPGLGGVQVRVGSDVVVTDSLGRFRVWDLVPFENASVEVDSLTLTNPLWYAARQAVRVQPGPNAFRYVTIGVLEGTEVNGRAEVDGRPLAGAPLVFADRHGHEYHVTTFTDGTFYVMRLPPGEYDVGPAYQLLEAMHATAEPLHITVLRGGTMRLDGVVVRVHR